MKVHYKTGKFLPRMRNAKHLKYFPTGGFVNIPLRLAVDICLEKFSALIKQDLSNFAQWWH